ncbi:hypothetical protein [Desulfocastanea catecholica]
MLRILGWLSHAALVRVVLEYAGGESYSIWPDKTATLPDETARDPAALKEAH